MSGLKLVIPNFVSTNPNLPVLREDKRLTEGSILLIDFSHPSSTSALANSSVIKNIAYQESMSLINTSEANVSPLISNTITSNGGLVQLTTKKGLNGIVSQVNDISDGNDFRINIKASLFNYIKTNIARGFYVSVWDMVTRLPTQLTTADFCMGLFNTGNFIFSFQPNGIIGSNLGSVVPSLQLNVPRRRSTGVSQLTGSVGSFSEAESGFKFGSGFAYAGFELNKAQSQILYAIHIIDLTAAGLTYAQADALDLANFNQAFSAGGRFANDTFTSPSTLP